MDPAVAAALDGLPFAGGHQQAIPVQLHPLATNMFQMPMPHQVPHPQVEDDDKILADVCFCA